MKQHILFFIIFTVLFAVFSILFYSLISEVNYTLIIGQSLFVGILITISMSRILKSGFFENKKKGVGKGD